MPPLLQFGMFHGIECAEIVPSQRAILFGRSEQPTFGLQEIWFDSKAALVQQSYSALSIGITGNRVSQCFFQYKSIVGALKRIKHFIRVVGW